MGTATASMDALRVDDAPNEARAGADSTDDAASSARRRKRVQNTLDPNIPQVRDITGEKVQESFAQFCRK